MPAPAQLALSPARRQDPSPAVAPPSPGPKARRGDPATAKDAAERAKPNRGTTGWRILEALRDAPGGLTYEQITTATGIRGVTASTRITELKGWEFAEVRGQRPTSSGAMADVIAITRAGLDYLDADRPVVAA